MKIMILSTILFLLAASIVAATPGAVWTTDVNGVVQNQNKYYQGEFVYVEAQNLAGNAVCPYEIIDVGQGNSAVFNGNVSTDSQGAIDPAQFVFDTSNADSGEYKLEVTCPGENKKSDNFKVVESNSNDVPEFGTISAIMILAAAGLYIYRKRN